jgi:hypothetical protein
LGVQRIPTQSKHQTQKSEKFNMSKIQINSLQTAGSELFQGSESFLTELQATEAHAVYGGKSKKKSNKGSKKKSNKGSNKGSNKNSGGTPIVFVPFPVPFYCPPCHC